jgi:hypothetical protein
MKSVRLLCAPDRTASHNFIGVTPTTACMPRLLRMDHPGRWPHFVLDTGFDAAFGGPPWQAAE